MGVKRAQAQRPDGQRTASTAVVTIAGRATASQNVASGWWSTGRQARDEPTFSPRQNAREATKAIPLSAGNCGSHLGSGTDSRGSPGSDHARNVVESRKSKESQ
jgi:hypothetical protein